MNRINQMIKEGVGLQQAYLLACEEDRAQWWDNPRTTNSQRAEALGYADSSTTSIEMWELLTIGSLGRCCFRYNDSKVHSGGAKSQLGLGLRDGSGDMLSFISDKPGVPSFEKFCEGMWTCAQEYYYTDADMIQGKDAIDVRNDFISLLASYIGAAGGARRAALDDARMLYEQQVIAPMEMEAEACDYMTDDELVYSEIIEQEQQEVKQSNVSEYINSINPIENQMENSKGKKFRSCLAMTSSGKQFIIGLPRRMSASAANKYVQYLRTMFDFIPLQILEKGWSEKGVSNLA